MIDVFLRAWETPECEMTMWMRVIVFGPLIFILLIVIGVLLIGQWTALYHDQRPTIDDARQISTIMDDLSVLDPHDAAWIIRLYHLSTWTPHEGRQFDRIAQTSRRNRHQ